MLSARQPQDLGSPLRGFEHVKRYWDKTHGCAAAKILPGEYYVTVRDELITTVLGSCVAACIRDRRLGVGGMNHFMLPLSETGQWGSEVESCCVATRYGNYAMEHMINEILKHGGQRRNLEAKVFGGGLVMGQISDIGRTNIEFVHEYLETEGIPLVSEDVGERFPRKVIFFPRSGRALVKRIRELHNDTVIRRERAYQQELAHRPVEGEVELF